MTLWYLKYATHNKLYGLLTQKLILLHDNANHHTVGIITQLLLQFCCECLI